MEDLLETEGVALLAGNLQPDNDVACFPKRYYPTKLLFLLSSYTARELALETVWYSSYMHFLWRFCFRPTPFSSTRPPKGKPQMPEIVFYD
jgi:hypothetical protein